MTTYAFGRLFVFCFTYQIFGSAFVSREYYEKFSMFELPYSPSRYGDRAPKSVIARLFCIIWIMVGLTVCSVMTATLTAALATAPGRDMELVGKKVIVKN